MYDSLDIIKNIESIYGSNDAFSILKDFERVLDHLDLYVYANWEKGEVAEGPMIDRHWVTCSFFWPQDEMPDPMGGKRLLDYDCKVRYKKSSIISPRKIEKQDDIRPGTKKGKLDRLPIWVVEIQMPTKLIQDVYSGYMQDVNLLQNTQQDKSNIMPDSPETQDAEELADTSDTEAGAQL